MTIAQPRLTAASLLLSQDYITIPEPLAVALGLERSVLLKSIDNWCKSNATTGKTFFFRDEHWWTKGSYEDWFQQMPYLGSARSVQRHVLSLEKDGLLITGNFNSKSSDRSKWYRVDHAALENFCNSAIVNKHKYIVPNWHDDHDKLASSSRQNGTMTMPKVDDLLYIKDKSKDVFNDVSQVEYINDVFELSANANPASGLAAFESVTPSRNTSGDVKGDPNHAASHSTVAKEVHEDPHPPKPPFPQLEVITTLADTLIDRATTACKQTKNRLAGYQRQAIRTYPELAKNAIADLESEIRSGSVENSAQCLGGLLKVYLGDRYYEFVKPKAESEEGKGKKRKKKDAEQTDDRASQPEPEPAIQVEQPPVRKFSRKDWMPEKGEEVEFCNGHRFVVAKRSKVTRKDGTIEIYLHEKVGEDEYTPYVLDGCIPVWVA